MLLKVEVTSKVDAFLIAIELSEPGVTKSFDVISGPSDFREYIIEHDIQSGRVKTYTWTICPNGNWTDGNVLINIFVQFTKEIGEVLKIQYSIANPHIFNE